MDKILGAFRHIRSPLLEGSLASSWLLFEHRLANMTASVGNAHASGQPKCVGEREEAPEFPCHDQDRDFTQTFASPESNQDQSERGVSTPDRSVGQPLRLWLLRPVFDPAAEAIPQFS